MKVGEQSQAADPLQSHPTICSCRTPRLCLLHRLRHHAHPRDLVSTDAARREPQRPLAVQRLLIDDQPEQLRGNPALIAWPSRSTVQ